MILFYLWEAFLITYSFMGNELGFYPVFKNDKFGFKNDNNDYSKNIDSRFNW